jgi:hypothetical protein
MLFQIGCLQSFLYITQYILLTSIVIVIIYIYVVSTISKDWSHAKYKNNSISGFGGQRYTV